MTELRTPKGTIDMPPDRAQLYEEIINKIRSIFQLYGALPIDTPTFELKSVLINKYGEDSKLMFDLKDQGGDICALRYDLTVPFSRYLAQNNVKKIKKYQIGKVFRRDQPSLNKGRLREFVQADFDIAGECIFADAEIISCMDRVLRSFDLGNHIIKVNDRRLLFAILKVAGVGESRFGTICSTIDKMDKHSWEDICREFREKGLNDGTIDEIKRYVVMDGSRDLLQSLQEDKVYEVEEGKIALDSLIELFRLCVVLGCENNLKLCLTLARGLEYYTGMILEAEYENTEVGSVAGGGRYDNLAEALSGGKNKVPCAGFSIGITRLFSLLEQSKSMGTKCVYVVSSGALLIEERLKLLKLLWDNGLPAETFTTRRISYNDFLSYCSKRGIQLMLLIGEKELHENKVSVIDCASKQKEVVDRSKLVEHIRSSLK